MKPNSPTPLKALTTLILTLSPQRRKQLASVALLMLISAFCEVATIGAVLPFLSLLATPDQVLRQGWFGKVVDYLGTPPTEDLVWIATLAFAAVATISGGIRSVLIYGIAKVSSKIAHELGVELFRRSVYQPYEVQVSRNSSETLSAFQKLDDCTYLVFALIQAGNAVITTIFVLFALLALDPNVTVIAFLALSSMYAALALTFKPKVARNSRVVAKAYNARIKCIQEVLGGIRDVLLGQTQEMFTSQFSTIDRSLRDAQASTQVTAGTPRVIIESFGMLLIAGLGYWAARGGSGIGGALPTLGAFALGMQRLIPLIQQLYNGFVSYKNNSRLLIDVGELLQQPLPAQEIDKTGRLPFESNICFEDVSFAYGPESSLTLAALQFTIKKGARVGIIGATGSGKSTTADLIMGLLGPKVGQVTVDGTPLIGGSRLAWQRNIAHVPQTVFLSDASFAENIAFGVSPPDIDLEQVRRAAFKAQLAGFIEEQPDKYFSMIGERGIRLSGGQRQRIAIARALYKGASVLVFDEATSALDDDTETAVMEAIGALGRDITIVMVAHRLRTLRKCGMILRLDKGTLVESGAYQNVVEGRAPAPLRQKQLDASKSLTFERGS